MIQGRIHGGALDRDRADELTFRWEMRSTPRTPRRGSGASPNCLINSAARLRGHGNTGSTPGTILPALVPVSRWSAPLWNASHASAKSVVGGCHVLGCLGRCHLGIAGCGTGLGHVQRTAKDSEAQVVTREERWPR